MKNILVSMLLFSVNALHGAVILNGNQSSSFLQNRINNALNMDGQLDQTFGNNVTNVLGTSYINRSIAGFNTNVEDEMLAIAIQTDGKVVVGGYSSARGGHAYFALARFNIDGTLDSAFGQNSQYTTSLIPGTVFINQSISQSSVQFDQGYCLTLQPDGKILLGGLSYHVNMGLNDYYVAIARFMPDGSLDVTFGATGAETTSLIPGTAFITQSMCDYTVPVDQINSLALQADGKIIAGGYTYDGTNIYCALMRFTSEGALDETFTGGNGTQSFVTGTVCILESISGVAPGHIRDIINSLAITSDGLLVAGIETNNTGMNVYHFALGQFDTTGALVSQFTGGNGTETFIPGTIFVPQSISGAVSVNDQLTTIVLQRDGKIVAGGTTATDDGSGYFAVARFLPNGALDTTFGVTKNDVMSLFPGTLFIKKSLSGEQTGIADGIASLVIQNDGKIVAAGYSSLGDDSPYYCAVARFTTNGMLDSNFGSTDSFTTSVITGTCYVNTGIVGEMEIFDNIHAIAIRPNGKIVATGAAFTNTNHFLVILAQFFNPQTTASYQKAYSSVGAGLNV